jgi:hypothetical protein
MLSDKNDDPSRKKWFGTNASGFTANSSKKNPSVPHCGQRIRFRRRLFLPRTQLSPQVGKWCEPHHTTGFFDRVERIVSDWCDRKQWLAQKGVSYNL